MLTDGTISEDTMKAVLKNGSLGVLSTSAANVSSQKQRRL